jgi:hygromycin-B 4-O-kinase
LAEATEFLCRRYAGHVSDIADLGGGDWSRASSFRLEGRDLVARFGQYREDFEDDRDAMAYAGPDLPVPAVLEIGEALGGAYAVSERSFGRFLEALDVSGWRSLLRAVWRALDALREQPTRWPDWLEAIPDAADGPGGLWGALLRMGLIDDPAERVSGWREALKACDELDELFVAGERRIAELLDLCRSAPHVLHGDLLNRNVIVSDDAARLSAVFDWGTLPPGDFLYELAGLTFWAPWFSGLAAVDLRAEALSHYRQISLDVPRFAERLRCYEIHIGLSHLAYHTFTGRTDERRAVADRTRSILNAA